MKAHNSQLCKVKISVLALLTLSFVGSVILNSIYFPLIKPATANAGVIADFGESAKKLVVIDLNDQLNSKDSGTLQIWSVMLGIANGAVALFFIVIALATIFNIQIDTYGVKKSLVPIIIGVILANLSLAISNMILDIGNSVVNTIINAVGNTSADLAKEIVKTIWRGGLDAIRTATGNLSSGEKIFAGVGAIATLGIIGALLSGGLLGGVVLGFFLLAIYMLIPIVLMLVVAAELYIRTIMIMILVSVSPIAFLTSAWGPTQGLFRKWWGALLAWIFMLPATVFVLWFSILFAKSFKGEANLATYVTSVVMLYVATQVPFKMGGVVMGAWGAMVKKVGGMVGKGAWNQSNNALEKVASRSPLMQNLGITSPRAMMKGFSEQRQLDQQRLTEEASLTSRGVAMERSEHGFLGGIRSLVRSPFNREKATQLINKGRVGARFANLSRHANTAQGLNDQELIDEAQKTQDSDQASAYITELSQRGTSRSQLAPLITNFNSRFQGRQHTIARRRLAQALARQHSGLAIQLNPAVGINNPQHYLQASDDFWQNMQSAVSNGVVNDPNIASSLSPAMLGSVLDPANIQDMLSGSATSPQAKSFARHIKSQNTNQADIVDNLLKAIVNARQQAGSPASQAEQTQIRKEIDDIVTEARK